MKLFSLSIKPVLKGDICTWTSSGSVLVNYPYFIV